MEKCVVCDNELNYITINKIDCSYCSRCELFKKINVLSDMEEKARYDKHVVDSDYFFYMKKIYENFKDYLKDGNILDFGSGKAKAIESISDRMVISYDKYYLKNEYKNNKYDNIVLIEVIEHISDFYSTLCVLIKLLNTGGRIIINTNLHNNQFDKWWYFRDITHVVFFSETTFKYIASKLKLKIITIRGNLIVLES